MNKIVHLSLTNKSVPARIDVVQYATIPDIVFLLDDYIPGLSANAALYIEKPDGTKIYNACTINENAITYTPTTQSFAATGWNKCQLQIIEGNGTAVSFLIYAYVTENIIDSSAIESQDEFTALEQAIQQIGDLTQLENRVTAAEGNITSLESDVATNTSDIATNTSDIATNAENIATNTANIATNTADIETLFSKGQSRIVNAGVTLNVEGASRQCFLVMCAGGTAAQHKGAWLVFNQYNEGGEALIQELKATSSATITGTTKGFTFANTSTSKVVNIVSGYQFTTELVTSRGVVINEEDEK